MDKWVEAPGQVIALCMTRTRIRDGCEKTGFGKGDPLVLTSSILVLKQFNLPKGPPSPTKVMPFT